MNRSASLISDSNPDDSYGDAVLGVSLRYLLATFLIKDGIPEVSGQAARSLVTIDYSYEAMPT